MILLISSVDLAILSGCFQSSLILRSLVFCSVEYYCSSPSPKFGHRLYMIPSSSFANFGIFSFHSSDFISSQLVQSASNVNMEYNDLQLVACDLTPDGMQEVSVLQRTKESVCSTAVMLTSHRHGKLNSCYCIHFSG